VAIEGKILGVGDRQEGTLEGRRRRKEARGFLAGENSGERNFWQRSSELCG